MTDTLLDRFLRYVQIDTQSAHGTGLYPSTQKQWLLLRLLTEELRTLGAADVTLTEHGYVLATLPATTTRADVPTIAYLAHVDTAPDFSGTNVKPIVHENYQGTRIVLPDDPTQVLDPENPLYADLLTAVGKDIITASGLSLLGADDKAGVAIIMTLADHLLRHPEIEHGPIRICFTPDEEIGAGVDHLNLDQLGAQVAYTLDGENPGEINWETFSAYSARVTITGVATHPGTARRYGMVNAVHLAGKLLNQLPREFMAPESTDQRDGFIHPVGISGDAAQTTLRLILREHDDAKLDAIADMLRLQCQALNAAYPTARIEVEISESYRNMGNWLKDQMQIVDLALAACRNVGLDPFTNPVRGGTDGSRLTAMGLPTPNVFVGGHNAHGPLEWVTRQDMEKAVEVLIELARLWATDGVGFTGGYHVRQTA